MAYALDMKAAAARHLKAAQRLREAGLVAAAGYLYGIAAECAIKRMAEQVPELRHDDILYAHLPELRTLVGDRARGRLAQELGRLVSRAGFMNNWEIRVRYAATTAVDAQWVLRWDEHAKDAVNLMSTFG